MSILASLVRAYDRLPDAPPYGYSSEKVGFLVSLHADGSVAHVVDLRTDSGKKRLPLMMQVPAAFKRPGVTPRPFFLWDNANYAIGAGSIDDVRDTRFSSFRDKHLSMLSKEQDDEGVLAFIRFLESWEPTKIDSYVTRDEIADQKIVFALESERLITLLHQRPAAKRLWRDLSEEWRAVEGKSAASAICLVSGQRATIARTHPAIKGIPSKGGKDADSLVSFNLDAFTSYGHDQGDNAPVSEAAAFAYTTTLNRFLERDSGHRIQIGDTSTVFWADSADRKKSEVAEAWFGLLVGGPSPEAEATEDAAGTKEVATKLGRIRDGKPLAEIAPELAEGVRFHVLGLAPNAARLSVRFMWEGDFGELTRNYQSYLADMRITPEPRDGVPGLWRYLVELAVLGKRENVAPNLAGDWMRSILTGARYPMTLLSTTLMRLRIDGDVNALRAAILKSVLIRNLKVEVPVALDPAARNKGYVLGRLFAIYEEIQRGTLGRKLNSTIRDKFYGSASSAPRKVFGTLAAGSMNHLSKLRKEKPKLAGYFEAQIREAVALIDPLENPYPAFLSAEDQAMFALGYYHQSSFRNGAGSDQETDIVEPTE